MPLIDNVPVVNQGKNTNVLTQEDIVDPGGSLLDKALLAAVPETHNQLAANPVYRGGLTGDLQGYIPTIHNKEYFAAHNQGPLELIGNAIGHIGAEFALGTIEAAGYLADIPNYLEIFKEGQKNFDNWLSEWARESKEKITGEVIPIYDSPSSEGFNPLSGRWWAKNAGTFGTTLALLVPSTAAARGIALIKGFNNLTKITQLATRGVAAGLTSRHVESLMEGNQLYYQLIGEGKSSEEAGEAAALSYKNNLALLATDIFQYASLFRATKGALTETFSRSKSVGKSLLKEGLTQAPIEAAEETYQTITGKEAALVARGGAEPGVIWGKGVSERMTDYFADQELWTAALLGAVTGLATPVAFDRINKLMDKVHGMDEKVDEAKTLDELSKLGKADLAKDIQDRSFMVQAFRHASRGTMQEFEDLIKGRLEEVEGDEHTRLQQYLKEIPEFEEIFNRIQNQPGYTRQGKFEHIKDANSELKTHMIISSWDLKKASEKKEALEAQYDEMVSKLSKEELSPELMEVKKLHILNELYQAGVFDELLGKEDISKRRVDSRKSFIKKELEEKIKALPEKPQLGTTIDASLTENLLYTELEDYKIRALKYDIEQNSTSTGQMNLLKKIDGKKGEEKKQFEEYLSHFLGEGVIISKGDEQWDIRSMDDKFMLSRTGDPDIPGASVDDFTDEEFERFVNTGVASPERLAQVANKKKRGESMTRKERAVAERKKEEIAALLASNQNNNEGKGFTRSELYEWMQKNQFQIHDNTEYRNRLEKGVMDEKKKRLREVNANLLSELQILQEKYDSLAQALTGKQEDALFLKGMESLLSRIEKKREELRNNQIEEAALIRESSLEEAGHFVKKARAYQSAAANFYDSKIDELLQKKADLIKVNKQLKKNATDLKEAYNQVRKDFKDGKVNGKEKYHLFKGIRERIKENEADLNKTEREIEEISQSVDDYKSKLSDIAGENLLVRQEELNKLLNGDDQTPGLRLLLAQSILNKNSLEKKVNDIIEDLLTFFDVPKNKLDDPDYIKDVLDKAATLNDKEINEKIKEARKKEQYDRLLKDHLKDLDELRTKVDTISNELEELKAIEQIAFPKIFENKVDDQGDVRNELEEVHFIPKRGAAEAFNFLRGRHFEGDQVSDLPHVQRYFKFVESNSITANGYYIKLVPYAIKGNPTDWSILLTETEQQRMRDSLGDKFDEVANDIIFAVIVDRKGNPIDQDGTPLQNQSIDSILSAGVFSTFPTASAGAEYITNYGKSGDRQALEEARKEFAPVRDKIRDLLDSGNTVFLAATSKGTGLPVKDTRKPAIMILRDPNRRSIVVAKRNELQFQGRQISILPGTVYLRDEVSGQINQMYPRRLNDTEVETVFQLIKFAKENMSKKNPGQNPFDTIVPGINKSVKDVLREFIYYSPKTINNDGGYMYEKVDPKSGKFTGTLYLEGLGENTLDHWINAEQILKDWIRSRYHQVRSTNLGSKKAYPKISWNGESFTSVPYESYETYLLDPDLNILETTIPAYTPDPAVPQRKNSNIYFDYNQLGIDELPVKESTKIKERPKGEPKKATRAKKKAPATKVVGGDDLAAAMAAAQEAMMNAPDLIGGDKPVLKEDAAKKAFGKQRIRPPRKFNGGKDRRVFLPNQSYVYEDIDHASTWFKERFPQVDFEVAYGLAKSGAWGRFTSHGKVLLDPYAEEGTIYHESFHVVMGLFLSPREKEGVLSQYRSSFPGERLSDDEIEERLAEDFREYVLTGERPQYKKPETFFERLLNFLKWIVGLNTPSIEEIFDNIKNGYYAKLKPDYSGLLEDKNRAFEDKSVKFTKDVLDGVNYLFWDKIPDGQLIEDLLNNALDNAKLKQIYDDVIADIREQIEEYEDILEGMDPSNPSYAVTNNLIEAREWIVDNFYTSKGPSVIDLHQEYLASLNVNLEIPELPEDEMEIAGVDLDNQFSEMSMEVSTKKTVSNQVKLWLSVIPKVVKHSNGEVDHLGNDLEFEVFEDFSTMFAMVSNKLADTTTVEEMIEELEDLKRVKPAVSMLSKYFFLRTPSVNLSATQYQRKLQFFQAFAKNRNTFTRILVNRGGDHSYFIAGVTGSRRKIFSDWESSFRPIITNDTIQVLDSGGLLSFEQALDQAHSMGMDIPNPELMDVNDREDFSESITWIAEAVRDGDNPYRGTAVQTYDREQGKYVTVYKDSTVKGRLQKVIEIAYQMTPDLTENSHIAYDGKTKYDNSQYTYYTYITKQLNKLAETIREYGMSQSEGLALIFNEFPHFRNHYSWDSKILLKISSGETLNTHIIEGIGSQSGGGKDYSKLSFHDNFIAQFNNTLQGRYHMLRPSDNKQERVFDWGLFMPIDQVDGTTNNLANPVNMLLEYLKSEVMVLKDANIDHPHVYNKWSFLGENLNLDHYPASYRKAVEAGEISPDQIKMVQSGILLSVLSSPDIMPLVQDYILENITLDEFIYNPKVVDKISSWFFNLLDTKVMPAVRRNKLSDPMLRHEYKEFPEETVAKLFLINYIAGNIEQTKVYTGHPSLHKSLEDFFKRMSGMVGTKTLPAVDEDTNAFLRERLKLPKDKPIVRTAVVKDPIVSSRYSSLYEEILRRRFDRSIAASKVERFYESINESDALGLISLDEYKEFKFRIGEWDWRQEAAYQWEKQGGWVDREVIVSKDNPYSEIAGKKITRTMVEEQGFFLPPLKPQYFGPLDNPDFFVTSYYKLSLLPVLPSMAQDRNLQAVSDKMARQKIGIMVFATGNKIGTRLGDATDESIQGIQSIYDNEGNIKEDILLTQDTDYRYWGIQVNNAPRQKIYVSSGTQFLKQIENNLFAESVPFDFETDEFNRLQKWNSLSKAERLDASPIYRKIVELRKLNKARQSLGVRSLVNRLGLREEEVGGEKVYAIDKSKVEDIKDYLRQQFVARDLPQNMIDSLRWIERGIDVMVNRERVENILFSIADKMTVSQKRLGKSAVQVASTFFETKGARDYNEGKFSSGDLKFYDVNYTVDGKKLSREQWEEAGKPDYESLSVSEMEVYLPHYFKELLGEEVDLNRIDPRLRSILGFRIPTQGLSSIENIRIKGFLPPQAGDVVVVPSEVIAKAGSDFDFDKMFLHFPNYEMVDGEPRYIEFSHSPSQIWEKRKRSFSLTIPERAREIDRIEAEYKDDIAKALLGKKIRYGIWGAKILPKLRELGIQTPELKSALGAANDYLRIRRVLIEEGLLTPEEKEVFSEQIIQLEEILEDDKRFRASMNKAQNAILKAKDERDRKLEGVYDKAFEEFDKLNLYEKNGKEAVENAMMGIHKELLSDYNRFDDLINPVATDKFKSLADKINQLKGRNPNPREFYNMVDPVFVINKGIEFQQAKSLIGRGALSATSHILFSQANAYLKLKPNQKIYLKHNRLLQSGASYPSLAGSKTVDGRYYISDLISELLSSYVDASKDPFIFHINGSPEAVNVMMLMVRLGVPVDDAVAFLNQPIIDDYLESKRLFSSNYMRFTGKIDWGSTAKIFEKYKPKAVTGKQKSAMQSLTRMYSMIEKYKGDANNLSDIDKEAQIEILSQFIMLEGVAKNVRNAIWGSSYDTAAGGKNSAQLIHRLMLTQRTMEEGVIGNYERLFEQGEFIEPFYSSVKDYKSIFTPYMFTLSNEQARVQFERFLGMTLDEFHYEKMADIFKSEFITYLVQTRLKLVSDYSDLIYTFSYNEGKKLTNSTVPRIVKKYQGQIASGQRASNALIEALSVSLNNLDRRTGLQIDNLSLNPGVRMDTTESNIYSEAWKELMETDPILAKNLGLFLWLQSGLQNSPNNFLDIMPDELYSQLMTDVLDMIGEDVSFDNFYHEFFLNNTIDILWGETSRADKIPKGEDQWPAYKVFNPDGSFSYYLYGKRVNEKKMKAIRNFRNNSSKKHYLDESVAYYLSRESKGAQGQQQLKNPKNEIDEILNQEDCGL